MTYIFQRSAVLYRQATEKMEKIVISLEFNLCPQWTQNLILSSLPTTLRSKEEWSQFHNQIFKWLVASKVCFLYSHNCALASEAVFHSVYQVWLSSSFPECFTFVIAVYVLHLNYSTARYFSQYVYQVVIKKYFEAVTFNSNIKCFVILHIITDRTIYYLWYW